MDTALYAKFKKQTLRTQVKKHIRAYIRTLNATQHTHLQYTRRHALISRITHLPIWKYAHFVVGYTPIQYECDVTPLLTLAQQNHKEVMIPLPDKCPMNLRTWETAHNTQYYISSAGTVTRIPTPRTPSTHHNIKLTKLDMPVKYLTSTTRPGILLVPGLAFTLNGNRLGRGGGYYDRLLTRLQENPHIFSIGVCLSQQLVPEYYLPRMIHDKRVDLVIAL